MGRPGSDPREGEGPLCAAQMYKDDLSNMRSVRLRRLDQLVVEICALNRPD